MNVQTNETDPPLSAICASNIMSSPKTSVDLQQVFSRFETFNFDNDQKFQAGLDKINRQASASKGKEHAIDMLKIKLFYYSRNVEPVDVAAYMEWRKGCGRGESPVTSEGHATEAGSSSHPQRSRDNVMCQVNENFICKKSNCPQSDDNQTEHGQLSGGDADKEPGNRSSYGGQSSDSPPCQDPSPCLPQTTVITTKSAVTTTTTTTRTQQEPDKEANCDAGVAMKQTETRSTHVLCDDVVTVGTDPDMSQDTEPVNPARGVREGGGPANTDGDDQSCGGTHNTHRRVEAPCSLADAEGAPEPLSFAEVAELIQSGKPIPGLSHVEVMPTNMDPTPSRLLRTKKPWEE